MKKNNNSEKPICKILTVDDQMGIDSFFYEFFSVRNYEVLNAMSGKEAIEIVKKERPRLVLLDINMSGMSGIEALKKIKEIDKNIVVIMVTGVKDDDVINEALSAGADDYITKPLSLEYLDKVVLLKFINLQIKDLGGTLSCSPSPPSINQ
ncbi:MAG: response regulator [Candidatus Omnitrophota bacterium]|nr:response regulator [Candidatus Omnitrophota bacterium]